MTKKIITVFGATGAQGGGLAKAILNDRGSEFSVRAITREANGDKAKELKKLGAEIVEADIDNPATIAKALEGAYGAYFVTFYWAHYSPEKEKAEAQAYARAAKAANLKHAIWSTLEDTRKYVPLDDDSMPTVMDHYKVPHFDAKGEADQYFLNEGVPVTFYLASFYWDNLIYFGSEPTRGADGKLYLTFPLDNKKMAGIASEDIGKSAYGVFKKGDQYIGQTVGVAGEHLTGNEMAEKLSKHLGEQVIFNNVTADAYRGFGFPGAVELGNMFQFYRDFDDVCNSTRSVERTRELNPELLSFDMWLSKYAKKIPIK